MPKKSNGAPPEEGEAERRAEATAGAGMPQPAHPDKDGKMGSDPGPDAGHDATWGVVAERHKREHGDMLKRHMSEDVAHDEAGRVKTTRQHKESSDMLKRHQEEFKTAFQGPGDEIEKGGGEGPRLGAAKSEGTKGTEP